MLLDCEKIDRKYEYTGTDLGCVYQKEETGFRVWAPTAEQVTLQLYQEGNGDCLLKRLPMEKGESGTWYTKVKGDWNGIYYTYEIALPEGTNEVPDVYATALGVNGKRSMVLDFSETDPEGWEQDHGPALEKVTDAIIYELHVRDLSTDPDSGIQAKGLFKGLTEEGTKSPDGLATGLDHIKEMGVTHVHLLPLHDFGSIDEEHPELNKFNWGYDPVNYTALEGSYSTDPYHGQVRVKEFKEVVQTFHRQGLGVVMDVVYNHTYYTKDSVFERTVPGYYYRMEGEEFANGSGCGNETASNHKMMRKYMIDSLCFWAKEYHIDGFRFDLMAIHDIDTMNAIVKALKKINPNIFIYGEGWAAKAPAFPKNKLAFKANAKKMPEVAMFNDNIRDTVKGHVFEGDVKGFVNGNTHLEEDMKFAVVGAVEHDQINELEEESWALNPTQSINYISAHDDLTLWDKLALSCPKASEAERIAMNKLAAAIVYTAQGVPFMQAGEELLRTKPGTKPGEKFTKDSYQSPDSVNSIKWKRKKKYEDVVAYYKGLIAFRKAHEALRMATQKEVAKRIHFLQAKDRVVSYTIDCKGLEKEYSQLCIIYNANENAVPVSIPEGNWDCFVDGAHAGTEVLFTVEGKEVSCAPVSALVLLRK